MIDACYALLDLGIVEPAVHRLGVAPERILSERIILVNIDEVYLRYQELQAWVGWTEQCARRVAATAELLAPHLTALIDDFYDEIGYHPNAARSSPENKRRLTGSRAC